MCHPGSNLRAPGGMQQQGRRLETSGKLSRPPRSIPGSEFQKEVGDFARVFAQWQGPVKKMGLLADRREKLGRDAWIWQCVGRGS